MTSQSTVDVARGGGPIAVETDRPPAEVTGVAGAPDRLSALMVHYQNGEAAPFRELFEALQRPLRSYLIGLTRDVARAEDLVQETFLHLHRSRATYRPPRPVRPWAFGIARYVFLMERRARGRRMRVIGEDLELPEELAIPARAFGLADLEAVRGALGKLPEDQRELLLLHHVWGFSFAEIGQTLGIRATAAKVRSHRAITRLRKLLGVDGER